MYKNIATMALLGVVSMTAETQAFVLSEKLGNQEKLYINLAMEEPESDEDMMVQTDKVIESLPSFNGWGPEMEDLPGTVNEHGSWIEPYKREVPERFQGDAADEGYPVDKFTQNIIKNYAVEVVAKDKYGKEDPKRTHKFVLSKDAAKRVAAEVLVNNMGQNAAQSTDFIKQNFEEAWNRYDVLGDGAIDAVWCSQFFRYFTKPLGLLDLQ